MKIKKVSKKREDKAGEDIGGKSHLASGSLWFQKGDASNEYFLVEDKFTTKNKYSISLPILKKIEKQALKTGKIPILRFGFEPNGENYAVIRECDGCHLIDDIILDIICTINNSKSYTKEELNTAYVDSMSGLFMFKLCFVKHNYYVLKWKDFVKNQAKFV